MEIIRRVVVLHASDIEVESRFWGRPPGRHGGSRRGSPAVHPFFFGVHRSPTMDQCRREPPRHGRPSTPGSETKPAAVLALLCGMLEATCSGVGVIPNRRL